MTARLEPDGMLRERERHIHFRRIWRRHLNKQDKADSDTGNKQTLDAEQELGGGQVCAVTEVRCEVMIIVEWLWMRKSFGLIETP